jgi:hypothetical protein
MKRNKIKIPRPQVLSEETGRMKISYEALTRVPTEEAPTYMINLLRNEEALISNYSENSLKEDIKLVSATYELIERTINKFSLSEKELQGDFSSITGLGIIPVTHSFLDEFKSATLSNKTWNPPQREILQEFLDYVRYHCNKFRSQFTINKKPRYPRGKNSGTPIIVSGKGRLLNDIILYLNASICQTILRSTQRGGSFKSEIEQFLSIYGTYFPELNLINFSRYQHNGKPIPKRVGSRIFLTQNLEPRRRIISSTIKPLAMINKTLSSNFNYIRLNGIPIFDAKPETVRRDIKNHVLKKSRDLIEAYDTSRFDLRHGYSIKELGIIALSIIFEYTSGYKIGADEIRYALMQEASKNIFTIYGGSIWKIEGMASVQSGISITSVLDSVMASFTDMYITSKALNIKGKSLVDYYITHEPTRICGDDMIKLHPRKEDKEKYDVYFKEYNDKFNRGMEIENPTKYIGFVVGEDGSTAITGENLIMKFILPERTKNAKAFPLAIGARLDLFNGDKEKLFNTLMHLFREGTKIGLKHFKHYALSYPVMLDESFNIKKFKTLQKDMLDNPSKYNLDNDYAAIDEILLAVTNGLHHDVDLSLIGLQDLALLQAKMHITFEDLQEEIFETTRSKVQGGVVKEAIKQLASCIKEMHDTCDISYLNNVLNILIDRKRDFGLIMPKGVKRDYLFESISKDARMKGRTRRI